MREYTREKRFKTRSAAGTVAIAKTLAEMLCAPRVVVLRGELGAGKTTLVKGWVEALGAGKAEDVTSPTFTLVHEYARGRGEHAKERAKVYHLDLYRLETERELATLGFEEMAEEPHAVVLVEWGEKFRSVLERADAEISLTPLEGDERALHVVWRD